MIIAPKTIDEARTLVYNVLNQGDSRYNAPEDEYILASFIIKGAVSLEERDIPFIDEPSEEALTSIWGVQKIEKYVANVLLKSEGFQDSEIFFERTFGGGKADVLAEAKNRVIAVECCSCRVNKIIEYLLEAEEVWVFTKGLPPWAKIKYLKENIQWFIFKKGHDWDNIYKKYIDRLEKELRSIPNPLDALMKEKTEKNQESAR